MLYGKKGFVLDGKEKFCVLWNRKVLCYMEKKSVAFPLSCGHLAQEPVEARGDQAPPGFGMFEPVSYSISKAVVRNVRNQFLNCSCV